MFQLILSVISLSRRNAASHFMDHAECEKAITSTTCWTERRGNACRLRLCTCMFRPVCRPTYQTAAIGTDWIWETWAHNKTHSFSIQHFTMLPWIFPILGIHRTSDVFQIKPARWLTLAGLVLAFYKGLNMELTRRRCYIYNSGRYVGSNPV